MRVSVLSDFVELQRGTTYRSRELDSPGPYLLGLASIAPDGGFRGDSLRTYGGASPTKLLLFPGDLYVSLKDVTQSGDLLGAVARVPNWVLQGRLTQDTVKLIFKRDDSPNSYLYWLLRTPEYRAYCRERGMGTTNLSLSRSDFLSFPVPTLNRPRLALVSALEALDAKIDLNRRLIRTASETAQILFRSWFVDFDPVAAKVAGRAPFGLDAEMAALFPSSFEDSSLGPIPRGWVVTPLRDFGDWVSGATPSRDNVQAWAGAIPWISAKSMKKFHIQTSSEHVDPEAAEGRARIVPPGTTLFVVRGMSLAEEFRVGVTDRVVAFNQDLKAIVATGRVEPIITGLFLLHSRAEVLDLVDEASHGTKKLDTGRIAALSLPLPGSEVQGVLAKPFNQLFQLMCSLETECRTAASLRDSLLAELFSAGDAAPIEAVA